MVRVGSSYFKNRRTRRVVGLVETTEVEDEVTVN